ncbi:MAG: stage II sporulation protein P [Firmicutes bacterium]|nr:stage II sporulation protein P [Bacillota bacterium]
MKKIHRTRKGNFSRYNAPSAQRFTYRSKRDLRALLADNLKYMAVLMGILSFAGAIMPEGAVQKWALGEALPVMAEEAKSFAWDEPEEEAPLLEAAFLQPEDKKAPESEYKEPVTLLPPAPEDMALLDSMEFLSKNYYITDSRTAMTKELFNAKEFLGADLKIDNETEGPKVLIFHTHSREGFADSDMFLGLSEGIVGVGAHLANILTEEYGIKTLHHIAQYDVVDGRGQILGAYERMEPDIKRVLRENPSIQLVIDMHRDGVPEDKKFVTEIDGKPTARIMFFNGLSMLMEEGELKELDYLPNPNLKTNLALSFNLQLAGNTLYPGFCRKIYLNAYRYSLHLLPKTTLIEVGAQTNTKEEALNAMPPLAEMIASVVL